MTTLKNQIKKKIKQKKTGLVSDEKLNEHFQKETAKIWAEIEISL